MPIRIAHVWDWHPSPNWQAMISTSWPYRHTVEDSGIPGLTVILPLEAKSSTTMEVNTRQNYGHPKRLCWRFLTWPSISAPIGISSNRTRRHTSDQSFLQKSFDSCTVLARSPKRKTWKESTKNITLCWLTWLLRIWESTHNQFRISTCVWPTVLLPVTSASTTNTSVHQDSTTSTPASTR